MKKQNLNERTEREEFLYHNTEILLKRYRDVVWSLEAAAISAKMRFESEIECKLEDFLEKSYAAGADFLGTDIQEQIRTLERSRKMLEIIKSAVDMLRKKKPEGEEMYWIVYYTYLSEENLRGTEKIIEHLASKIGYISWNTYYRKRGKAIKILSTILWGYTSRECLPILKEFM